MIWIDTPEKLEVFCEELRQYPYVAVDTESDQYHSYRAVTCLVQVASPKTTALVDPLAMNADELAPLLEIFEDPSIEKILHACSNDLVELDRDFGVRFANVFDTQYALKFLGYRRDALEWVLNKFADVKAEKAYQRFDWRTRPIPPRAAAYAAMDVDYLFMIRDRLYAELDEDGWLGAFEEHCEDIVKRTRFKEPVFKEEGWRKIKTRKNFSGRDKAVLRELYLYRHDLCLRLNRAAFMVIDNAALARIAEKLPDSRKDFRGIRGLSDDVWSDYIPEILEAIDRGLVAEIPPEKAAKKRGDGKRSTPGEKARYEALRNWRNTMCQENGWPFELVTNNETLWAIARKNPKDLKRLKSVDGVLTWQIEEFGAEIVATLQNHAR